MKTSKNLLKIIAIGAVIAVALAACGGGKKNSGGGGSSGGDADIGEAVGAVKDAAKAVKGLKESPASDFAYDATSDGKGVVITKYTGDGGKVVIPAQIEGLPVVELGMNSFIGEGNYDLGPGYNLTSVVIPASVKKIGYMAFETCKKLTSVTIQGSGVELGMSAFANCTELSELVIPDGDDVLSGTSGGFNGCKKLPLAMRTRLKAMGFTDI